MTFNNAVTINLMHKILSQPSQTQKPQKISYPKTTEEVYFDAALTKKLVRFYRELAVS